jgi:uncharacterized protein DUF763
MAKLHSTNGAAIAGSESLRICVSSLLPSPAPPSFNSVLTRTIMVSSAPELPTCHCPVALCRLGWPCAMTQLGTAIAEHNVISYGASEFLSRLSDPFWFQALGCVMGMEWHSSGITTSVMGALKRGLNPRFSDLGIVVCDSRGRHATVGSGCADDYCFRLACNWPISFCMH